jgi:hypothetical protein
MAMSTSPGYRPMGGGGISHGAMLTLGGGGGRTIWDDLQERKLAAGQREGQLEAARIGANASMYPHQLKQERFDTIFPWLQGQLGSFQSQMATAGGQSGPSPEITVGGVYNPQQIQQQVNSARATNDRTAAGQMRRQSQDVAGRGFGSSSPLLMAMNGMTQANNMATNTDSEREIRMGAAQQNAGHVLNTQQAREGQFASRQREDIERRKPIWNTYNNLLGSLVGLA